jgi:hypothetical protein
MLLFCSVIAAILPTVLAALVLFYINVYAELLKLFDDLVGARRREAARSADEYRRESVALCVCIYGFDNPFVTVRFHHNKRAEFTSLVCAQIVFPPAYSSPSSSSSGSAYFTASASSRASAFASAASIFS